VGVTDAGGWVGATLAVDGGRSVVGEGCSIFSVESRDGGRQLKQGELRQSVRRDLYVWQVVCPPRHHTLEASPLRARDLPRICLPRGSPGQIRRV